MTKQEEKYAVGMAGEHFVAAELFRRGVLASVTMGNAKKADVIVRNLEGSKIEVIEIKSSSHKQHKQWVVGGGIPESNDPRIWVFVGIPTETETPPTYYICTAKELNEILTKKDIEWSKRYQDRHNGESFKGRGVITLTLTEAENNGFQNKWKKILDRLKITDLD